MLLRLPGFGTVVHVGRRTRTTYRTPALGFRRGDRLTFALTYGPNTDWARNVVAAGGCRFEDGGRTVVLGEPRLYRDPARRAVPRVVRLTLRLLGAADFLELRVESEERRLTAPLSRVPGPDRPRT
jgi:deazaflavin-dependent oxidoreductase (nitroreductase family)